MKVAPLRTKAMKDLAALALLLVGVVALLPIGAAGSGGRTPVNLGDTTSFAVLAGTTVTNVGPTLVQGDLGVSPGTAVTGFPPGIVTNGAQHTADAQAARAQVALTTAYNDAAGRDHERVISSDLGGLALSPGVYKAASAISLNGTVTLHGQGHSDSVFILQATSTLTTASNSRVKLIGGAQACNVFWQVGSSATLGTGSDFAGNILAYSSVTVQTAANVDGRILARHAQVSLHTNSVKRPPCLPSTTTSTSAPTTTSSTTTTQAPTTTTTTTQPPTTTTTAQATTTSTAPSSTTTTTLPLVTVPTLLSTTTSTLQLPTTTTMAPATTTTSTAPTTTTSTGPAGTEPPGNPDADGIVLTKPDPPPAELPKTGSPVGTSVLVALIALGVGAVVARCGDKPSP